MATNAYYLNQFISTTLSTAGGIDDSQTTGIKIASTSGITTDKPGILCLSYSSSIDTTKAEWITYTSIDISNELQGVTRGAEGFSAKSHSNGVAVAFPISRSHINNLNDALIIGGAETNLVTGVIDDDTMATASATTLATSESTKAYVDNGIWLKDSLARQAIINGNFDVWQRGTSATTTQDTGVFLADRFYDFAADDGGTAPTLTRSRQLLTSGDIPNAFYHTRLTTNGAGTSLGINSQHSFNHKIEHGTRLLCGLNKKVTVSFWARSDIANKRLGLSLQQNYGSGGSPSASESIITFEPITLTSTWTKYTVIFTTNTLVGKTFGTGNDDYLRLLFYHMWGSTIGNTNVYPSVTAETYVGAGNIDIAQVQLCAGDVALPFMPKSYEEELDDCKYYARFLPYCFGFIGNTNTQTEIAIPFYKFRNATATATVLGALTDCLIVQGVALYTPTNIAIQQNNYDSLNIILAGHAAGTVGLRNQFLADVAKILISVEL